MIDEQENDGLQDKEGYIDGGSVLDDDDFQPRLGDTDIVGNQSEIAQELHALLSEASENHSGYGSITVNVRRMKHYFAVLAKDEGIEEDAKRIYKMVQRWLESLDKELEAGKNQSLEFVTKFLQKKLHENAMRTQEVSFGILISTLANFLAKSFVAKKYQGVDIATLEAEVESAEDLLLPYLANNL